MAVNKKNMNSAYGLNNPLQQLSPEPIIAHRDPTSFDRAELGTLWVNTNSNAYFVCTSIVANSTTWQAQATGSGTFTDVTVTGAVGDTFQVVADSVLGGTLDVTGATTVGSLVSGDAQITGNFDVISSDEASITSSKDARSIYLHADGGTSEQIEVRSDQGTGLTSIYTHSDVGGVKVESGLANVKSINLVASAGGIKGEAALTSEMVVTGASQDIKLTATGGSITMAATEAANDAISITASDAAGKVAITGAGGITNTTTNTAYSVSTGTGAINVGTDAAAKTITIGNVTGATAIALNSGTGGIGLASTGAGDITLNSSDTVLIDSAGVLELNSSAGVISIGNDSVAQNINIGTGASARVVTVGNVTGVTGVNINTGTAGSTITTTNGAFGVVTGTGAINVGTDAVAKTITVGNITGATSVVLDCGTGACNLGVSATAHTTTVGSTTAGSTLVLNTPTGTSVSSANGLSVTTAGRGITLPGPVNIITGAGAPAAGLAVNIGDLYIRTDAGAANERIYIATAANTWTTVSCAA